MPEIAEGEPPASYVKGCTDVTQSRELYIIFDSVSSERLSQLLEPKMIQVCLGKQEQVERNFKEL